MHRTQLLLPCSLILSLIAPALAHEHHNELTEEQTSAPVDAILWIHIFVQAGVWGILFPTGMVLGMSKSRWHVPLQVSLVFIVHSTLVDPTQKLCFQSVGIALTLGGYILGHAHGGRAFLAGIHGIAANIILIPIFLQLALGVYLKLHIHEETLRPWAVRLHGVVGKSYPILGWAQMLFGAVAFRGYCRGGHLGQCLAHYIMVRPSSILLIKLLSSPCTNTLGKCLHCVRNHLSNSAPGWRAMDPAEW